MRKICVYVTVFLVLVLSGSGLARPVPFTLLTHDDNVTLLPQPRGQIGVSGDHLLRTIDDITHSSYNPDGCFSFTFLNPVGVSEPDYPPGYVEGIHCMTTGSLILDVDLTAGGAVGVREVDLDGYVSATKPIANQRLVRPGDPAADGSHGPVDGQPNSGSYRASAAEDWAFTATCDWYYDTPFGGSGTIDMTFDNYLWSGFIIPVSELTSPGMAAATLEDALGYFSGSSEDFEQWLLLEVYPRVPEEAVYLLFAQGEGHPVWTHPMMGMGTSGIVAQTIIGYGVPEPATMVLLGAALCPLVLRRRRKKPV